MPKAFLQLSDLAWEIDNSEKSAETAKDYITRFIEVAATPDKREAWIKLADRCNASLDPIGEIHAVCEAVLLSTSDIRELEYIRKSLE